MKITINLNMTIQGAQKIIDNWIKEKGVRYFNELTNTTILMEEVGELARIVSRKYGEQSFNCLLYTSPSPRDTNPSRMPSSA